MTLDLLNAIDGKLSTQAVIECVEKVHNNKTKIYGILSNLLQQFVLIDANYTLSNDMACFWLQEGILPVVAQTRLEAMRIACVDYSQYPQNLISLHQGLLEAGLLLVEKDQKADMVVVIVDDYLNKEIEEIHQTFTQQKQLWLLVKVGDNEPWLGPVFSTQAEDFCYQCLHKRIIENRQVRHTLSRYNKGAEVLKPLFHNTASMNSIAYQFGLEIARFFVIDDSHLSDHIQTFDWHSKQTKHHFVAKLPNCKFCGTPTSQTPIAFEFDNSSQEVITSGGYKTRSPFQTLAKYQALISPISGIINELILVSEFDDDWVHVYESGNNIALQADNVDISLVSTRMKNAGKGTTREQAKVSALAESIERYCSAYQGTEIIKQARFTDFDKGSAILPNEFMHYSQTQYENSDQVNSKMSNFYHVPGVIDVNKTYDWSPIWSILEQKHYWVPTQLLYFGYPYADNWIASADTNGTASGNSKTEAFVQGFLELIERDNIAIWWSNCLSYPEVDLSTFADEHIKNAVAVHQARYNRKLWAIDVSSDTNIPTFVVISYVQANGNEAILFGCASHFDANVAMLRAVCEHSQLLEMVKYNTHGQSYHNLSHEFSSWLKDRSMADKNLQYLKPSTAKMKTFSDYESFNEITLNAQKQACIDLVKHNNWDLFVVDLTRSDIAMPVVKVMIKQLRSMHMRLSSGRLYDVPVKMGWLDVPLTEEGLNPISIFI
ncbi:TOMM biosynthesis cyclodehydratase (protein C) / TOMM biosynthesis docking scaffold (protein D) [uncultured Candidatus Thioglobus sp.]|nr:TOMM biosynthesis cyclodehydratase (protein C) / TOMM biosynthesis docking scaffold (protein D) [uncultured Candidatus Thioglobus sp.]